MSNIVRLATVKEDCRLITPEQTLVDALEDIRSGKRKCNKMLICMLDSENEGYSTSFYAANVRASEAIALLEVVKQRFLDMIRGKE